MKVFNRDIFPRTNLRLLKDALARFGEILFSFFQGNAGKSFVIIDKRTARRIIDYYGGGEGHQIDKKTGNLGYGFIHYSLIRNLKPKRALCIGSTRGFIPAICALACKDNKKGLVDFIDAGHAQDHPQNWGGTGFWKKINSKKHFSLLGIDKWIETYVMTSGKYAKKFPQRKYGFVYIDGDHSYKGVKGDYELFWPRLEKNGFMAFHDVTVKKWGKLKNFGVWRLWKEIKNKRKIIFPLKQSGLGIIQKQ